MKTKKDILNWWQKCGLVKDKVRNDLKDFIEKTKNAPIDYKIKDCPRIGNDELKGKIMEVWTKRSKTPITLYFLKDPVWICIQIRNY